MKEAIQATGVTEAVANPNTALAYIETRMNESGKTCPSKALKPTDYMFSRISRIRGIIASISGRTNRAKLGPDEWCLDRSKMPQETDPKVPYKKGEISQWTEFHWNSLRWLVQMQKEGFITTFDWGRTDDPDEVAVFVVSPENVRGRVKSRYWELLTRPSERMPLSQLL